MTVRNVIVDDRLLLRSLLAGDADRLPSGTQQTYTTGLWYHRLARAIADQGVTGSMSRLLGDAPSDAAGAAAGALIELPEEVGLISLRKLAWPMAALVADGVRLNLLALEALAAAIHLDAEIHLSERGHNPHLAAAAVERGVPVRVLAA